MRSVIVNNKNGGYIALISAVIITFVLTGLAYAVARSGFFSRFDSLNSEYKRVSKGLAESCANQALLKLAQAPKYAGNENVTIGENSCDIQKVIFDPAPGTGVNGDYDIDNKKVANIVASAHYPDKNGAYSLIKVSSTVYDPQFAPPARVVVNGFVSGSDATVSSFIMDGSKNYEIKSGHLRDDIDAGTYVVTENESTFDDAAYNITVSGVCKCDTDENNYCKSDVTLDVVANAYAACNITYTLKPNTAKLTIIISANPDDAIPSEIIIKDKSYPVTADSLTQTFEIPAGSDPEDVKVAAGTLPGGYGYSDWVGEANGAKCSGNWDDGGISLKNGDNAFCAIAIGKKSSSSRSAVTVVMRVVNGYGGTAEPDAFPATVTAQGAAVTPHSDPTYSTDKMVKTQVYYIDPGSFKITQNDTTLTNYSSPSYYNAGSPFLCEGNAAAGQGYLCLITDYDMPTTFTMTATVNVTQAYSVTPVPAYTLALDGIYGGHYTLTSGQPQKDIPAGIYTISLKNYGDYSISNWGPGSDCVPVGTGTGTGTVTWTAGGTDRYRNCAINIVENQPVVLKVVTQVVNNYDGTKTPDDFPLDVVAAKNLVPQPDTSGAKIYYMQPGDFEISQKATGFDDYAPPEYQETTYPRLCHCKAAEGCVVNSGQSYVCVITNRDIPKKFNLMATVNITRAYGVAPAPSYTVTANPIGKDLTTGSLELDPGTYTVSISGVPSTYSVSNSKWGGDCSATGQVSWSLSETTDLYKNCSINLVENPPPFRDIDSVLMLDRTASMFGDNNNFDNHPEWIGGERAAAKSFLNLYNGALPPQVGIGVFSNDSDSGAMIAGSGNLTSSYGGEGSFTSMPNAVGNYNPPTQWLPTPSGQTKQSVVSDGSDSSYISATNSGSAQTFTVASAASVPVGSKINSVTINVRANGIPGGYSGYTYPKIALRIERASGSYKDYDPTSNTVTNTFSQYSVTIPTLDKDPFYNQDWTINELNTWGFGIIKKNNAGTLNVYEISVIVNYSSGLYTAINTGLATKHWNTDLSAAINKANTELNSTRHIINHKKYIIMLSDGQANQSSVSGDSTDPTLAALQESDKAKTGKGTANDYVTEIYTIHFGSVANVTVNGVAESSQKFLAQLASGDESVTNHRPGSKSNITVSNADANNLTATYLAQVDNENNDGDHFFIVPVYADPDALTKAMTDIFNKIGKQILDAGTPPSATTGTLNINTYVYNENGGTKTFADFPVTVTNNGSTHAFDPRQSAKLTMTLVPGDYTVAETSVDGYTKTVDPLCAGTIKVGEEINCVIVNDDSAPDNSLSPQPEPSAPPAATTGTLNIVTYVFNTNGGTKTFADFPLTVNSNGVDQTFDPRATAKIELTLDDKVSYSVAELAVAGYTKTVDPLCTGTIQAGKETTCVIIDDDSAASSAPYSYGGTIATPENVALPPTLVVITYVSNSNLYGSEDASSFDFTIDNPATKKYDCSGSPSSTGTVTLNNLSSGAYNVTSDDNAEYSKIMPGCSGSIGTNQIKTCAIIYTAKSQDIIPIKNVQNIEITSWAEE